LPKRLPLPGGSLFSLMPQRCICRQSNFGVANPMGGILMSPAFSPPRMSADVVNVQELDALEKGQALDSFREKFKRISARCTRIGKRGR
jgi:hypothetical protein